MREVMHSRRDWAACGIAEMVCRRRGKACGARGSGDAPLAGDLERKRKNALRAPLAPHARALRQLPRAARSEVDAILGGALDGRGKRVGGREHLER